MRRCEESAPPHGERGLKYEGGCKKYQEACRSPHGERGLKYLLRQTSRKFRRRSPHGERGLKSCGLYARQYHPGRSLTGSVD